MNGKVCDRKYMFGDKFTFGSCYYCGSNCLKKVNKKKQMCTFNKGQLPIF